MLHALAKLGFDPVVKFAASLCTLQVINLLLERCGTLKAHSDFCFELGQGNKTGMLLELLNQTKNK